MHFVDAKGILTGKSKHFGMNIYRGCSHGCIYCDSRSKCYQMDHAFEDIEVKRNAPELLEIIKQYGFGAAVLTKSDRIIRDIDLLEDINRQTKAVVQMTLTTYDDELCSILEPNVCNTKRRIEVLEEMQKRGIPTVVWLTPILPFINDSEENIRKILQECVRVGVRGIICFDMGLTLREGDREYFYAALDRHFPGMKERYIARFGNDYSLPSPNSIRLMEILHETCRQHNIICDPDECFRYIADIPDKYTQMSLFNL